MLRPVKPTPNGTHLIGEMAWPGCNQYIVSVRPRYRVKVNAPRRALHFVGKTACMCMLQAVYCFLCYAQGSAPPPGQTQQGASQAAQILASYEGQNVSSVEIAGHPELNVSQFSSSLAQKSGTPFSQKDVNATASALKSNGKFTEVRVQVEPEGNGLRVLFILEPAVYIGIFRFPGAARFTYSRLVQIANYPSDTPFNQADIEQARQNLLLFFRQQGYFQAQVSKRSRLTGNMRSPM